MMKITCILNEVETQIQQLEMKDTREIVIEVHPIQQDALLDYELERD